MIVFPENRAHADKRAGFRCAAPRVGLAFLLGVVFLHATSFSSRKAIAQSPPLPEATQSDAMSDASIADVLNDDVLEDDPEANPFGFRFFGYLQQGVTLNPDSPNDRTNGPVLNNYRSNAYQMNGLYLVAERQVNPDQRRVQLGGRIDTLYGTDAAFAQTNGLDARIVSDSASRFYKLAFPQIYADLFLPIGPGVHCKVGNFFSPIGSEWISTTENFFYSHYLSWNFQPGTHTGLLAGTKLLDSIDVEFGPNFGWNTA